MVWFVVFWEDCGFDLVGRCWSEKMEERGMPKMTTKIGEDGGALDGKEKKWGLCRVVWMVIVSAGERGKVKWGFTRVFGM